MSICRYVSCRYVSCRYVAMSRVDMSHVDMSKTNKNVNENLAIYSIIYTQKKMCHFLSIIIISTSQRPYDHADVKAQSHVYISWHLIVTDMY